MVDMPDEADRRPDGTMPLRRWATPDWSVTEVDEQGRIVSRQIRIQGEPEVTAAGALVVREPVTGAVALIWAPGQWLSVVRHICHTGASDQHGRPDHLANHVFGRLTRTDELDDEDGAVDTLADGTAVLGRVRRRR